MFRLRDLSATLRDLASPSVTDGFAVLTHLGDPLLLLVLIAVYYWLADERDGPAQLVAFTLLAVAVTVTLKNGLALPRPPAAVQAVSTESTSYGFPSGHAIGATVVYGGLVAVDDRLQRLVPTAILAGLIGLVGLSRVVIGVHYLGDILAGFAVGAGILVALWHSESHQRPLVTAVATIVATPALLFTAFGADSTFVFGACLGGTLVFGVVDTERFPPTTASAAAPLVALGLLLIGGAYSLAVAIGHPVVTIAAGVVMLGGSLVLPVATRVVPVQLAGDG